MYYVRCQYHKRGRWQGWFLFYDIEEARRFIGRLYSNKDMLPYRIETRKEAKK